MSEYITVGCLKCLACWDWHKDSKPDSRCPACGIATAEYNFDRKELRWTSVVKLLTDQASVHSFHDQREKKHDAGCRVCRGRRARQLAPIMNTMMREQRFGEVRRLIQENKDAAPLAVTYAREEHRHILESIVRQEFGIEVRPIRTEP